VPVASTEHIVPSVVRTLDQNGIDVLDVVVRRPTLDDVFLQLTGHRAEDDVAAEPAVAAEGASR
jgi:ABC-2 type transport system ATP-binding protein